MTPAATLILSSTFAVPHSLQDAPILAVSILGVTLGALFIGFRLLCMVLDVIR
jgi:hypothetical protein